MTDMEKEKLISMVLAELEKQSQSDKSVIKKIMAVFTGGLIGLDDALKQMQLLQREGYKIEAVLTPNAKKVIGKPKLQESLGSIPVYDDSEDFNKLLSILAESDVVLIPVMTMNTAAKVANGINDNLATTLIQDSLLSGKPVIGVRDACNLQHLHRQEMGQNKGAKAYNALLVSNLERLEDYGMELCEALELVDTVKNHFGGQSVSHSIEKECQQVFEKRLLSVADLPNTSSKIRISPQTIVTPAAKDAIKERGIEIVIC